jgi:hypothetical protein
MRTAACPVDLCMSAASAAAWTGYQKMRMEMLEMRWLVLIAARVQPRLS